MNGKPRAARGGGPPVTIERIMDEHSKILAVDDEAVIAGAANKILRDEGFRVQGAADAEMALKMMNLSIERSR